MYRCAEFDGGRKTFTLVWKIKVFCSATEQHYSCFNTQVICRGQPLHLIPREKLLRWFLVPTWLAGSFLFRVSVCYPCACVVPSSYAGFLPGVQRYQTHACLVKRWAGVDVSVNSVTDWWPVQDVPCISCDRLQPPSNPKSDKQLRRWTSTVTCMWG